MEPSDRLDRIAVLISQSRYELAEAELRKILADEPDFSDGYSLLAICLAEQGKLVEANSTAEQGIHLAPDESFSFYAMARVLVARERWREAEKAVRQAIEIDPHDESHFSLLAGVLLNQDKWQAAFEAAEKGLELDPEHVDCINLRAVALRRLGRDDKAGEALESAMQYDPEDALTHLNLGWSYVEKAEKEKALEHFREALRLDPELDAAREGMIDAIHSRNVVYRAFLKFGAWSAKQSKSAQWIFAICALAAYIMLDRIADANPLIAVLLKPLLNLFIAFAVLSWISDLVFKLLLRFNPDGRRVLSHDDIVQTNWGAIFLVPAAVFFALEFVMPGRAFLLRFLFLAYMVWLVAAVFECPSGWSRNRMIAYSIVVGLCGTASLANLFLLPWMSAETRAIALPLGKYAMFAFIGGAFFADDFGGWLRRESPNL